MRLTSFRKDDEPERGVVNEPVSRGLPPLPRLLSFCTTTRGRRVSARGRCFTQHRNARRPRAAPRTPKPLGQLQLLWRASLKRFARSPPSVWNLTLRSDCRLSDTSRQSAVAHTPDGQQETRMSHICKVAQLTSVTMIGAPGPPARPRIRPKTSKRPVSPARRPPAQRVC